MEDGVGSVEVGKQWKQDSGGRRGVVNDGGTAK